MNVLVTGGSGYFGSLLVTDLVQRGASCRVYDLRDSDTRPPQASFIAGDIRDAEHLAPVLEGIEVVYHNVAQVPLARNRALFDSVNRQGTETLLAAALHAGVRKVVHTSTSAVFGIHCANPVTEETPCTPAEDYGAAKYQAELLCRDYASRGLDIAMIRPRTILGPGRLGIFQILFEWVREGRNLPVFGAGANRYQFLHAADLADALIRAAQPASQPGPHLYLCGTDRFGTMREGLEDLCRHAGTGSRVRGIPHAPASVAIRAAAALGLSPLAPYHALMYGESLYFDISKAVRELGWHPRHSNSEMLIESYEWYLEHRFEVLAATARSPHRSAVKQGALRLLKYIL